MTKENSVVTELKEVKSSILNELQQGKKININELRNLLNLIDLVIADYYNTVTNLDACNSLVVKFEKFLEVIGMIEYTSVDNESVLENATSSLLEIANNIKQK